MAMINWRFVRHQARRVPLVALLAIVFACSPLGASWRAAGEAAAPVKLTIAPHRAVYTLSLEHAEPSSGIVAVDGDMQFEWADVCTGWTVEQRYKMTMQYGDGNDAGSELSVSFVTFETKDGKNYRFDVRKQNDKDNDEEIKGDATLNEAGVGEARFTKPENRKFALSQGSLFPTAHTLALIRAALAGENFIAKPVFDGSKPEGAEQVTAGIGAMHPADAAEKNPLLRTRWWPMRLGYFPADSDSSAPDYEFGMDIQENGIARHMTLDYGNFVVQAKLEKVESLPKANC